MDFYDQFEIIQFRGRIKGPSILQNFDPCLKLSAVIFLKYFPV